MMKNRYIVILFLVMALFTAVSCNPEQTVMEKAEFKAFATNFSNDALRISILRKEGEADTAVETEFRYTTSENDSKIPDDNIHREMHRFSVKKGKPYENGVGLTDSALYVPNEKMKRFLSTPDNGIVIETIDADKAVTYIKIPYIGDQTKIDSAHSDHASIKELFETNADRFTEMQMDLEGKEPEKGEDSVYYHTEAFYDGIPNKQSGVIYTPFSYEIETDQNRGYTYLNMKGEKPYTLELQFDMDNFDLITGNLPILWIKVNSLPVVIDEDINKMGKDLRQWLDTFFTTVGSVGGVVS